MYKFLNYYNSLCSGLNNSAAFAHDPYITAIRELLVFELQQVVYYIEKLKDFDVDMKKYTDKVIEFISILIVNLDFQKESFFVITKDLYENKKSLEQLYIAACEEDNIKPELLTETNLSSRENILRALNDRELNAKNNSVEEVDNGRKNLYEIIINLVLNACNCLIELKNYSLDFSEAKDQVLKLLNSSNIPSLNQEDLIKTIKDFSKCNYKIMQKLYSAENQKYGPSTSRKVEIGEKAGKCILVSGSSLIDLEKILIAAEKFNVNVYTHYEMLNAFKFKKLAKFSNLACHYKNSDNNFSVDFASFPGPIYISGDFTNKADVIRGQIYTTAKYPPFGIAHLEKNDFAPLIEYALKSTGFDKDKISNILSVGCSELEFSSKLTEIDDKIQQNKIEKIFIIGQSEYLNKPTDYLKNFINQNNENALTLVFADIEVQTSDFLLKVNSFFDFSMLYKIIEHLTSKFDIKEKIGIYFTDCNSETASHIFNLLHLGVKNIFIGICCPALIKPALSDGLFKFFEIKKLSSPQNDVKF